MNKRRYKKLPKQLKSFFKKEEDGNYSKKESKPERDVRLILESLEYKYEQEFNIKYNKYNKFYDFFVFSEDKEIAFIIEVMSFWHGENLLPEFQQLLEVTQPKKKKKKPRLTKTQKKNIRNDRIKAKICKTLEIPLITVWAYEIEHFPKRVIKRIKEEWKRQENGQI